MRRRVDVPAVVVANVSFASLAWTAPHGDGAESALLVPTLFALVGVLGPLWGAGRRTSRFLVGIGSAHLVAFALSAAALAAPNGAVAWHLGSQILFVVGFSLFVALAASYPEAPPPLWSWWVVICSPVAPLLAAISGPTPVVLAPPGQVVELGPVAAVLPSSVANATVVVFALPVAAVLIACVRAARARPARRAALAWPIAALAALAVVGAVGAFAPEGWEGLTDALFLIAAPLLPVALAAGSRAPHLQRGLAAGSRVSMLTPREREVLALMARGNSNPAIGRHLHVSLSAVEKHSTAIFAKLGLPPEPDTHRRVVAYLDAVAEPVALPRPGG